MTNFAKIQKTIPYLNDFQRDRSKKININKKFIIIFVKNL